MSFLVINMLLVIAFCSTWLLSFITHSNHDESDDDIENEKGQGRPATPQWSSLSQGGTKVLD